MWADGLVQDGLTRLRPWWREDQPGLSILDLCQTVGLGTAGSCTTTTSSTSSVERRVLLPGGIGTGRAESNTAEDHYIDDAGAYNESFPCMEATLIPQRHSYMDEMP